MNRNGRHDRKGKGDNEQHFFHTPSVTALARCQNEIPEVFCFQKTDNCNPGFGRGPRRAKPFKNAPGYAACGESGKSKRVPFRFRMRLHMSAYLLNAKNRPVSRAVFAFITEN